MLSETYYFLKKHVFKLFFIILAVSVLFTIIFYMIYSKNPTNAVEQVQSLKATNSNVIKNNNSISFFALLLNNLKACTLYLIFGFLAPLSLLTLILLTKSVGITLVYSEFHKSVPAWKSLIFGILPHGIFEFSSYFLALAIGLYIGTYWIRKHKEYDFKTLCKYTGTIYCSLIVPLIIISALIETYITPKLILNML